MRENISPGMFPANGTVGVPDVPKRGGPAQIVNMPMRTLGNPGVMTDPRPYSARSQGAAHVDVVARLNGESAQPSNLDGLPVVSLQDKGIAAGVRIHLQGHLY